MLRGLRLRSSATKMCWLVCRRCGGKPSMNAPRICCWPKTSKSSVASKSPRIIGVGCRPVATRSLNFNFACPFFSATPINNPPKTSDSGVLRSNASSKNYGGPHQSSKRYLRPLRRANADLSTHEGVCHTPPRRDRRPIYGRGRMPYTTATRKKDRYTVKGVCHTPPRREKKTDIRSRAYAIRPYNGLISPHIGLPSRTSYRESQHRQTFLHKHHLKMPVPSRHFGICVLSDRTL